MSNNHWSIYLLSLKGGSVCLNMRANWDEEADAWDTRGMLECSTYTYTKTNSCIQHWDYPVPDISIGQICTLLLNKERDSSKILGGGSGWVWVSLKTSNNRWTIILSMLLSNFSRIKCISYLVLAMITIPLCFSDTLLLGLKRLTNDRGKLLWIWSVLIINTSTKRPKQHTHINCWMVHTYCLSMGNSRIVSGSSTILLCPLGDLLLSVD